ncbi:hypothetical protein GF340_04940 [Candidatus Peregrinibacteria bacterium]|nr:hypothetical protein [Candidatus Peregrinibacteria bacterium]
MKKITNHFKKNWWKEKNSYKAYAVREITGTMLTVWATLSLVFLFFTLMNWNFLLLNTYIYFLNIVGLIAAIIHSLTWFAASTMILPFNNKTLALISLVLVTIMINLWITII